MDNTEQNQTSIEFPAPKCAMSIHAHPDDQEFTVAGTLAKWAQAGTKIISVIVTSGNAGSNDPSADLQSLAQIREKEQREANRIIGVSETVFLNYQDGILQPTLQLRRDLTRVIRQYRPEVVVTGDPTVRFHGDGYMNHPDHRAAADAACDAVFPSAGTRPIFPELLEEGLEPVNVHRVYLHGSEKSNQWVDITTTVERKILALQEHRSQLNAEEDIGKMIREWASEEGKAVGLAYAEAYRVMTIYDSEKQ